MISLVFFIVKKSGRYPVWVWDITWLPGPVAGTYYYLYLMLDLFSRKVVGWEVFTEENSACAAQVLRKASLAEKRGLKPLVLHSDNGSPMKGATIRASAATHPSFIVLVVFIVWFKPEYFCAQFIGRRSLQSLGLDAGLARRGVQSKKVERDMADQRKVVGDMACTGAGVIVTELNIEAPVQTMASRPGESHPQPLTERCVNLSIHTAPIKRTHRPSLVASVQRDTTASRQVLRESETPVSCGP